MSVGRRMTPVEWVLLTGVVIMACGGDKNADVPERPAATRALSPTTPPAPVPETPPSAAVEPPPSEPSAVAAPPDLSTVEGRIAAVERQLQPAVRIRGRPVMPMQLADRMKTYRVQGVSIAVINDHQIEWARGYGLADAESRAPVNTVTLFQAGSISKPVAATAALVLVQTKKLDLERNLRRWQKSWKLKENEYTKGHPVTLRFLLSHTAGLTVHGFPGYARGVPLPTVAQVLDGAKPANTAAVVVDQRPGEQFRYSGGGYTVLQQLLVDVTRKPFPDLMQETVLQPLGMNRSSYHQPPAEPLAAALATGHDDEGRPIAGKFHLYPEMAAAGLWSTPSDLARYAIEIQLAAQGKSRKVLRTDLIRQMLTSQANGPVGLGLFITGKGPTTRFGHGGVDEGFESEMVAYVDRGQGAVVMTNTRGGRALATEVLNGIAAVYGWPDYGPGEKTIAKVDPAVYDRFVGTFGRESDLLSLVKRDNRLFMGQPGKESTELYPQSVSDYFTTEWDGGVSFLFDPDGRATTILLTRRGATSRYDRKA